MQPLVSIALTTYNGARYLPEQMASLLAQDYPNLEIVVSDDGSTDATCALLAAYAAQDQRIRVLDVRGNVGFNANFARCFAACRGTLISPCDQDDVWHVDKTSRLVDALGDATLVYANSRYIDSEGQDLHHKLSDDANMVSGSDPRVFLFDNSVSGHSMLFRHGLLSAAGMFPAAVYFDWWLAFVAANVGRIEYLDAVLIDYRRHSQAVTITLRRQNKTLRRQIALRTQAGRLAAMAGYSGPCQHFARELHQHWLDWYGGLLGWPMFSFVRRHAPVLFQASAARRPGWQRAGPYLIGHRLRRFLLPDQHPAMEAAPLPPGIKN